MRRRLLLQSLLLSMLALVPRLVLLLRSHHGGSVAAKAVSVPTPQKGSNSTNEGRANDAATVSVPQLSSLPSPPLLRRWLLLALLSPTSVQSSTARLPS
jgi:hypothetical protein